MPPTRFVAALHRHIVLRPRCKGDLVEGPVHLEHMLHHRAVGGLHSTQSMGGRSSTASLGLSVCCSRELVRSATFAMELAQHTKQGHGAARREEKQQKLKRGAKLIVAEGATLVGTRAAMSMRTHRHVLSVVCARKVLPVQHVTAPTCCAQRPAVLHSTATHCGGPGGGGGTHSGTWRAAGQPVTWQNSSSTQQESFFQQPLAARGPAFSPQVTLPCPASMPPPLPANPASLLAGRPASL